MALKLQPQFLKHYDAAADRTWFDGSNSLSQREMGSEEGTEEHVLASKRIF